MLILPLLLFAGCALTKNPIYTRTGLIEPMNIAGTWKYSDQPLKKKSIHVQKSKSQYKTFHITFKDPYTVFYNNCRFIQLGGSVFADIEKADSNFKSLPLGHLILKMEIGNDTCKVFTFRNLSVKNRRTAKSDISDELDLHFAPLDEEAKKEFMFNDSIITDPTLRLQEILAQHANNPEVIIFKPILQLIKTR